MGGFGGRRLRIIQSIQSEREVGDTLMSRPRHCLTLFREWRPNDRTIAHMMTVKQAMARMREPNGEISRRTNAMIANAIQPTSQMPDSKGAEKNLPRLEINCPN